MQVSFVRISARLMVRHHTPRRCRHKRGCGIRGKNWPTDRSRSHAADSREEGLPDFANLKGQGCRRPASDALLSDSRRFGTRGQWVWDWWDLAGQMGSAENQGGSPLIAAEMTSDTQAACQTSRFAMQACRSPKRKFTSSEPLSVGGFVASGLVVSAHDLFADHSAALHQAVLWLYRIAN